MKLQLATFFALVAYMALTATFTGLLSGVIDQGL